MYYSFIIHHIVLSEHQPMSHIFIKFKLVKHLTSIQCEYAENKHAVFACCNLPVVRHLDRLDL